MKCEQNSPLKARALIQLASHSHMRLLISCKYFCVYVSFTSISSETVYEAKPQCGLLLHYGVMGKLALLNLLKHAPSPSLPQPYRPVLYICCYYLVGFRPKELFVHHGKLRYKKKCITFLTRE